MKVIVATYVDYDYSYQVCVATTIDIAVRLAKEAGAKQEKRALTWKPLVQAGDDTWFLTGEISKDRRTLEYRFDTFDVQTA